ncbi:MAG: C-GCAxxG-C-C family protein [Lachnospiraceae bacterium]
MVEIDEKKAGYWLEKSEESPRGQRALALFKEGYNCSQAVALAFADLIGMDEKLLARVTSSFGGGMGRMREVCGAVSGMFFVAGALYGYEEPGAAGQQEKAAHYARIQELADEYRAVNGSIICRELLGINTLGADQPTPELRTAEYYKKRPCGQLVMLAATIMESYIKEHPLDAAN